MFLANDVFNMFNVPTSLASRFLRGFHRIAVKANNKLMSSVNNSRRISFSEPIITRNYHAKQVLSAGNLFSFWVEYGGFNRTMLYLLPMGLILIFYLYISIISLHHIAKSRRWTVTLDGEVPGAFLPSFCNSPLAFSWVICWFCFLRQGTGNNAEKFRWQSGPPRPWETSNCR